MSRSCVRCKQPIAPGRLEAMPETRVCVKCSEDIGGEFEYTLHEENLAKSGSLKKNYGGISVKRTRKYIEEL